MAKLQSVMVLFLFYLTQAIVTRRTAVILVGVMILSGVAGTLWSVYDLARGRGVVVDSVAADSPFRRIQTGVVEGSGPSSLAPVAAVERGDTVWRVDGHRVYSVADIDNLIRQAKPGRATLGERDHSRRACRVAGLHGTGTYHRTSIAWRPYRSRTFTSLSRFGMDQTLRILR